MSLSFQPKGWRNFLSHNLSPRFIIPYSYSRVAFPGMPQKTGMTAIIAHVVVSLTYQRDIDGRAAMLGTHTPHCCFYLSAMLVASFIYQTVLCLLKMYLRKRLFIILHISIMLNTILYHTKCNSKIVYTII